MGAGNKQVMILDVTVDGWLHDVNESLCLTDVMVGSPVEHTPQYNGGVWRAGW